MSKRFINLKIKYLKDFIYIFSAYNDDSFIKQMIFYYVGKCMLNFEKKILNKFKTMFLNMLYFVKF